MFKFLLQVERGLSRRVPRLLMCTVLAVVVAVLLVLNILQLQTGVREVVVEAAQSGTNDSLLQFLVQLKQLLSVLAVSEAHLKLPAQQMV